MQHHDQILDLSFQSLDKSSKERIRGSTNIIQQTLLGILFSYILVYAGGSYYFGEAAHYEVHSLSNFARPNSIIISYQSICQIYCFLWGQRCCCNINAAMYFVSAYGDKGDIYCVTNGGIDEESNHYILDIYQYIYSNKIVIIISIYTLLNMFTQLPLDSSPASATPDATSATPAATSAATTQCGSKAPPMIAISHKGGIYG